MSLRVTVGTLALLTCCEPKQRDFVMPRSVEDVRARLLPFVEGHPIGEARAFMQAHGLACDANICHSGKRSVVLIEQNGRVRDVRAY